MVKGRCRGDGKKMGRGGSGRRGFFSAFDMDMDTDMDTDVAMDAERI